MFMDIPSAAAATGFSLRHFRRLIEDDKIPVIQIGRKFFILSRDIENWKEKNGKRKEHTNASQQ